jgi:hypothetical protein
LEGKYLEGQTQEYRLEDNEMSADAFRLLACWLYSQDIERPAEEDVETEVETVSNAANETFGITTNEPETQNMSDINANNKPGLPLSRNVTQYEQNLVKLWVLADYLQIPALQNLVITKLDELWVDYKAVPLRAEQWLNYLYENTREDCPLRNLVLDRVAYNLHPDYLAEFLGRHAPKEFLLELSVLLSRAVRPTAKTHIVDGKERDKYTCRRTWRSYLVPEDM